VNILQLTGLGGTAEVGASCFLLQVDGKNILLDAGVRVNRSGKESLPDLGKLGEMVDNLDLVLVSHAHMDHTGALPLILEMFPQVKIYCTKATKAITSILLRDAVKIMTYGAEEGEDEVLYDNDDIDRLLWVMVGVEKSKWHELIDGVWVNFHPCGHVLGASSILLRFDSNTVVYSGDISVSRQKTVDGMLPIDFIKTDVLIIESTYGGKQHPSRKEEERKLALAIAEVIESGGTVLIPSFALGRAQEIILSLRSFMISGVIPEFPVYVDGMVRDICDVYEEFFSDLSVKLQNYVRSSDGEIFWSNKPLVKKLEPDERITMFTGEPKCIVSSSGMLTGGPSVYYAKVLAPDKKNAIFLTGYQDEESPGRKLQELKTGDELELDEEKVPVNCRVERYNLSAHADQIQICQQISFMNPDVVVLVHGEWSAIQELRDKLVMKSIVHVPTGTDTIDLTESPEWLTEHAQQMLGHEDLSFEGEIEYTDDGVLIKFDKDLVMSYQWKQFFKGNDDVQASFFGKGLRIKPLLDG